MSTFYVCLAICQHMTMSICRAVADTDHNHNTVTQLHMYFVAPQTWLNIGVQWSKIAENKVLVAADTREIKILTFNSLIKV